MLRNLVILPLAIWDWIINLGCDIRDYPVGYALVAAGAFLLGWYL